GRVLEQGLHTHVLERGRHGVQRKQGGVQPQQRLELMELPLFHEHLARERHHLPGACRARGFGGSLGRIPWSGRPGQRGPLVVEPSQPLASPLHDLCWVGVGAETIATPASSERWSDSTLRKKKKQKSPTQRGGFLGAKHRLCLPRCFCFVLLLCLP